MPVSNPELIYDDGKEVVEASARRALVAEALAQLLRPDLVLVLVEPALGLVGPLLGGRVVSEPAVQAFYVLTAGDLKNYPMA